MGLPLSQDDEVVPQQLGIGDVLYDHGWAEPPGQRPDFAALKEQIKPATEMRVVDLPELVRRVDELFAATAEG